MIAAAAVAAAWTTPAQATGAPAELEACAGGEATPTDLLAVRTMLEQAQPSPVEAIVVASVPSGIRAYVAFSGPVVVPGALSSEFKGVSRTAGLTVIDLKGAPPGVGRPEKPPHAFPLTLLPGGRMAVLEGEPGGAARAGADAELGQIAFVPGMGDYAAAGGCLPSLRVLPSVGGVIAHAEKPIDVSQSARETLIKVGTETISLSTCCAKVPGQRATTRLQDLFDPAILADRLRIARAAADDVPFDRAPDLADAAVLISRGDFSESLQLLGGITEPAYAEVAEIGYLRRLAQLGKALSEADGEAIVGSGPRLIESLPGGRLLAGCRAGAGAKAPDDEFARLRGDLSDLAPAVRRVFILCETESLKTAGQVREALALLRALAPIDGAQGVDPTLAVENILLLDAAAEGTLAELYRARVQERFETDQVPVDLRPFADNPAVMRLFSPEFIVAQLFERRLSFGDPALDARLVAHAFGEAPAGIVERTLDRLESVDRLFPDPRLRRRIEVALAARLAGIAGRDDAPLSLPALMSSVEFLRTRASAPGTAPLAFALSRSALNIGLTDMALDLLETGIAAREGATAGGLAPDALDDTLRPFVARYLDIASAVSAPGEAVERLNADVDQHIRPRHPAAAERIAAFAAAETAGFVQDASGLGRAPEARRRSPEAALLDRIRKPDLRSADKEPPAVLASPPAGQPANPPGAAPTAATPSAARP